ncbi:CvpA family protein [Chitinasiproducens palmae]|uniref:CvpA family protein n=1 Tax=Chitinasiproducens palmae TaxID=1770053 RepID=UPI000B872690|nr:CvpA family protein [Chitinasiproducens palmae]
MLTGLDYVILAVLLLSALRGAWRGLLAEVLSLVGWVVAVWLAARYGWMIARYVPADWPGGALTQWALGFVAVVAVVMLASGAASALLGRVVGATWLRSVDSSLGFLFGALRGALLVLIMIVAATYTELPRHDTWRASLLRPYAAQALRAAKPHLPAALSGLVSDEALAP